MNSVIRPNGYPGSRLRHQEFVSSWTRLRTTHCVPPGKLYYARKSCASSGSPYASENLTRLDLPSAITRGVDGTVIRHVFGTVFGIRPGEAASVKDRLGLDRAVLGSESESCFDFLRNQHIFRD